MDSHNVFMQGFTLLTTADFGHGTQLFALDTGALLTVLSAQFYQESKGILGNGGWASLELAGAGGTLVSPAFILHTVQATLGGGCAGIENVPVLTEPTGVPDEFYGNIGQSALKSFASFTIDFITMSFSVSKRKPYACPVDN